jgi:mono/diheme cytochrome c family protein
VGTERAPDLSTVGKRKKRPQIEQQILHGGNGMPAFGAVLQPDEVQLLVDYLSAKRKARRR